MASYKKNKSIAGTAGVCFRLAQPEAAALGLELWDVRFVREGPTWFLRIYIDKNDGYISVDDCVAMSHRMDKILDEADPIPHAYCLEVCSPGIERELVRPEHFKKFEGHPVSVRLYHPIENKREYRGVLVGYQDGSVIIRTMDNQQKLFSKKSTSSVNVLEDWDDLTKGETDNEQREH